MLPTCPIASRTACVQPDSCDTVRLLHGVQVVAGPAMCGVYVQSTHTARGWRPQLRVVQ